MSGLELGRDRRVLRARGLLDPRQVGHGRRGGAEPRMGVDELELLVERHRVGDVSRPVEHDLGRIERPGERKATEEAARALEQGCDRRREGARGDDVELIDVEGAFRLRRSSPDHQPPASRMRRWRTRAATSRRYSAVERTSSIGWSSAASVSAA